MMARKRARTTASTAGDGDDGSFLADVLPANDNGAFLSNVFQATTTSSGIRSTTASTTTTTTTPHAALATTASLLLPGESDLLNIQNAAAAAEAEEVVVTNVVNGITSILTCSTLTTISTTACATTTSANGATGLDRSHCSSTSAIFPTCQAGYICSSDPSTSQPTCLVKNNSFGVAGTIIAGVLGFVVVCAVVGIATCVIRDKKRTRRVRLVREKEAMTRVRHHDDEDGFIGGGGSGGDGVNEDRQPLMAGDAGMGMGGRNASAVGGAAGGGRFGGHGRNVSHGGSPGVSPNRGGQRLPSMSVTEH